MSFDNTNSGAIFKNEKKADNHPDYRGTINVDGVDKEIALWVKTSKDGTKTFFSAKISEPFKKAEGSAPSAKVENDSLPF